MDDAGADLPATPPPPVGRAVRRPEGPATLADVARDAGVSLATASRSLNGSARNVRAEYRDRVLAAAQRLDYAPNRWAQAVAKGSSQTLALVVADIADAYFSSIASGVMAAAEDEDLIVTMGVTQRRPDRELALIRALRGQRPRGIVLVGSRFTDPRQTAALATELAAFEASGGRATLISQHQLPVRTVVVENEAGAAALATALHGLGYRHPAVLAGPPEVLTAHERTRAFRAAFAELGCPVDPRHVITGEFTRDGGFLAAAELISRLGRLGLDQVDVIFAVNDVMAVGAMAYLRTAGLELPGAVGIAGFDDIPGLRDITPALTTVSLPLEQIGRSAVELTLDPGPRPEEPLRVSGSVVVRESTPPR